MSENYYQNIFHKTTWVNIKIVSNYIIEEIFIKKSFIQIAVGVSIFIKRINIFWFLFRYYKGSFKL